MGDFALTKSKFSLLPLGREQGRMKEEVRENNYDRAPDFFLTKAALCFLFVYASL